MSCVQEQLLFDRAESLIYGGVREVLNQATRRRGVATALRELGEYREARDGKQHINEVSGGMRLQLQL